MKAFPIVSTLLVGLLVLPGAAVQDGPFADHPAIATGETQTHETQHGDVKLSSKGSGIWYRFEAVTSGPITIDVVSADYDVMLAVRDADNEPLASDANGGVEWNAHLVFEVEAGSVYRIGALALKDMAGVIETTVLDGAHAVPSGIEMQRARVAFRERVAERAGERGDVKTHLTRMLEAGNIGFNAGLHDEAEAVLDKAARLAAEEDDAKGLAYAHAWLGAIDRLRGDHDAAREHLELSLENAREAAAADIEQFVLDNLSASLRQAGQLTEAQTHMETMLESAERSGSAMNEFLARRNLAELQAERGLHAEARETLQTALDRAQDSNDPEITASAWLALGNFRKDRNEFGPAADAYEVGLEIARPGDAQMALVGGMGNIHLTAGRYAEARLAFLDVLAYSEESGNRHNAASARMNLGIVNDRFGDQAAALEDFEAARTLYGAEADARDLFALHSNIAAAWSHLDDEENERAALEAALEHARQTGDPADEAAALTNLGYLEQRIGRLEEARARSEAALALIDRESQPFRYGVAVGNLADVDLKSGDHAMAMRRAREAVDLMVAAGADSIAVDYLGTLAGAAVASGDVEAAVAALAEAEPLLALPSQGAVGSEEAAGLRSNHAHLGEVEQDLIALRIDRARNRKAERAAIIAAGFENAGRWKGRALLEGIAEHRRGNGSRADELRKQRTEVFADRTGLQRGLAQAIREKRPANEIASYEARLTELDDRADELARELEAVAPRDAALDTPRGLAADAVRAAMLDEGTILVDYVAGEHTLYAYVLTPDGLEFVTLGGRDETVADIDAFRAIMADGDDLGSVEAIVKRGKRLFASLLKPVLDVAGDGVSEILVVPSGELATLPFEALVVASGVKPQTFADVTFVLDRWSVEYGPSAPVFVALSEVDARTGDGKVLVLGDPIYPGELPAGTRIVMRGPPRVGEMSRLLGTRDEAVSIAGVVLGSAGEEDYDEALERLRTERTVKLEAPGIDVYLGGEATPERLHGNLRAYSIVHCASHGYVDQQNPKMSGLALAFADNASGYLPLADVLELEMDADLTVLSACQTAQGRDLEGEGLQSMARAFMYAGSRAVVASLWQVSDRETSATMSALYERHMTDGLSLPESLRQAKRELRAGSLKVPEEVTRRDLRGGGLHEDPRRVENVTVGHPYFWAPFIHVGR